MTRSGVRRARAEDLPDLHGLVERTYRGDTARQGWTHEADLLSGQRTTAAELAAVIGSADQSLLVLEMDGRIRGTVTVSSAGAGRAYLGMLCVDPSLQGAGIGRSLIEAAEHEARTSLGASVMEMTVIERRAELIAWYERCGYRRTGERRPFPASPAEPVDFAMVVLERTL